MYKKFIALFLVGVMGYSVYTKGLDDAINKTQQLPPTQENLASPKVQFHAIHKDGEQQLTHNSGW